MKSYYVEYNYPEWDNGGGFKSSPNYYNYKHVIIKAQNIDNLRAKIINDLAKGKPFRSHVYRMDAMTGLPDYDNKLGDLYHYPSEYVWFVRETHSGWVVSPKTGKRMR